MFIFEKEYLGFFENKHLVIFMDELSYKKEQKYDLKVFLKKIEFYFVIRHLLLQLLLLHTYRTIFSFNIFPCI